MVRDSDSREKIRDMIKEVLAMANIDVPDTIYDMMKETGTMEKSGAIEVGWDEYYNAPVMVIVAADYDLRGTEYEDFHHYTMPAQAVQAHIQATC